ncbi:MAG: ABC transporter permease [Acidobacteria bacterium]|nr:ABC transporter permease [Acidobacteriota bacterium]
MNWRRFLRREQADTEQREELESYLELTAQEYVERGMNPAEARAAARRKLGNLTLIQEEVYHMNTISLIESLWFDVRHALRMLGKQRAFSVAALLSLALGIGANTAIFSVVHSILIRPLPYPNAERLVSVNHSAVLHGQAIKDTRISPGMYAAYKSGIEVFEEFGVWTSGTGTVTGVGEPDPILTVTVTQGVLPLLGVQPAWGRWFSSEDDTAGSAATVILSHGYWQRKFGGDRRILGRTIVLDGTACEVIGVMPADFRFLNVMPDVFVPQRFPKGHLRVDVFNYSALARLRPGVPLARVNEDLARVLRQWADAERISKMLDQMHITPAAQPLKEQVVGDVGTVLWVVMGALALVLLLVCSNVANLVLVRAQARRQEFAIRAALGAGWGRIARELLVESLTLGLLGGVLGVAVAFGALRLLLSLKPQGLPRLEEIQLHGEALVFALACAAGASLVFGLAAVMKCGRSGRLQTARTTTHNRHQMRAQNVLASVQVALALVLLVASGLMIHSFVALRQVTPGFTKPEWIQTVRISIPEVEVKEPDSVIRMQAEMLSRLAAVPGVDAVGFANGMPMEEEHRNGIVVAVEGQTREGELPPNRGMKQASPGLLAAQGTRLVAGRDFTWEDVFAQRHVVMVSKRMANETWGGTKEALGKRLRPGIAGPWKEVVGVVEDVHEEGVHREASAAVYLRAGVEPPLRPGDKGTVRRGITLAIRSKRAGSEAFLREVSAAIHGVNPNLPLAKVRTLQEVYLASMARTSFTLILLSVAGTMALTLSIVGVYGVLSYTVEQRRKEAGIRVALGATPGTVKRLFVGQGLWLACGGGIAGLAGAAALSRWISTLLFGVKPHDPGTYAVATMAVVAAALAASYVPARRAATADPMETLRSE